MNIESVAEIRDIDTEELRGYFVNNATVVPLDPKNVDYQAVIAWIRSGNTPAPAYTEAERLEHIRRARIQHVNAAFERDMRSITSKYPETEMLSWNKQEAEARAYQADDGASTPLLDAISASSGVDKAILAGKIVQKAEAYARAVGAAIGKRQALESQILAASTIAELEAIVW